VYHITQLAGVKYKGYFSPTSVDPPELIRFIREYYPEVEFTKITKSIYQEFINRKCLPSMRIRWCCAEFKEKGGEGKVVLVGVRHEESLKRSKRKEVEVTGRKFSGNIDGFNEWSKKRRARKSKDKNFDQFSEHEEQMVTCINGHDKIVVSPIIDWTEKDVWEFLNKVVEVPYCKLYDEGYHRIGCICCPMASIKNTIRDIKRYPHVKENWIKAIMEVRRQGVNENTPPQRKLTGIWSGNF
jgi:phosphoadenosine phosphosulfate reductase